MHFRAREVGDKADKEPQNQRSANWCRIACCRRNQLKQRHILTPIMEYYKKIYINIIMNIMNIIVMIK